MLLPGKILTGSSLVVGTGTIIAVGYIATNPKNIEEQLKSENISLLNLDTVPETNPESTSNYSEWKNILTKNNSENIEAKEFANWGDSDTHEYQKINKLKEKCGQQLKISRFSYSFWGEVNKTKKFCTNTAQA